MHFDRELLHLAQAAVHLVHKGQVRSILCWVQSTYRLHSWNLNTTREMSHGWIILFFFFLSLVFIYPSNRAESNQFNRNRWFYFLPGSQRIRGGTSLDGRPGSAGLYPYWRSGKPKAASPFHCAVSQMTKRPTLIQYWKSPTDTPYLRPSGYLLIYY